MPWQNQGGGDGPWGNRGGGSGGPWGGRGGGGGGGPQPPDLEEFLRKGQDRLKGFLPGGFGGARGIALLSVVAVVVWLATGFYRVEPEEQGVALIFGQHVATTGPGLQYNLPAPIGSVVKTQFTTVRRTEVGFRTSNTQFSRTGGGAQDNLRESLMLTGDENIIDIQFVVFWRVANAENFVFNVRNPDATVKSVSESVMREIIGQSEFTRANIARGEIQTNVRERVQTIMDDYAAGVVITQIELQKVDPPGEVIDAFRDVQAARADRERAINEAQADFNQRVERASGDADRKIRQAEAFKQEKIERATGEAQRFLSVFNQYKTAPDITQRRIYLETMEEVLSGMDKTILDLGAVGGTPLLPAELFRREKESQ